MEIKQELDRVHGESAPSFKTVCFWMNEFKRGRTSVKHESRSGRPKEVTTDKMITKVHDLVLNGRLLKLRLIADTVGISKKLEYRWRKCIELKGNYVYRKVERKVEKSRKEKPPSST